MNKLINDAKQIFNSKVGNRIQSKKKHMPSMQFLLESKTKGDMNSEV